MGNSRNDEVVPIIIQVNVYKTRAGYNKIKKYTKISAFKESVLLKNTKIHNFKIHHYFGER